MWDRVLTFMLGSVVGVTWLILMMVVFSRVEG